MLESLNLHMRTKEKEIRQNFGQQITLSIPYGSPSCASGYTFNENKQICINTDGKTAQPTRSTTDYSIWVMTWWVVEEELQKYSIGNLKVGDCELDADVDYYDNFSDAVKEEVHITLSGDDFTITSVTRDPVGTKILIGCKREE